MGRPTGYSVLEGRETELNKYLELGLNKTSISKLMGVSRGAVYNYLSREERIAAHKAKREVRVKKKNGRPVIMKGETARFQIQIEKKMLKRFKKVLVDHGKSGASVIRQAIEKYVEENAA